MYHSRVHEQVVTEGGISTLKKDVYKRQGLHNVYEFMLETFGDAWKR